MRFARIPERCTWNTPPQVQAMLLRAMEERRVTPVGSDEDVRVDARLVAATHRDLPQRVHAGEFRADLAFRFTLNLQVPSLAERKDDIPAIARGFARLWVSCPRATRATSRH